MRQQVFKDRLFDGFPFRGGLDNQITAAQALQLSRRDNPLERCGHVSLCHFPAPDLTGHVRLNQGHRLVQRLGAYIRHFHVVSGQGHDMCDAVAHLACAHDADCLNVHATPFLVSALG